MKNQHMKGLASVKSLMREIGTRCSYLDSPRELGTQLLAVVLFVSVLVSCNNARQGDTILVNLDGVEGYGPIPGGVNVLPDQSESPLWTGACEKVHGIPSDLRDVSIRSFDMQSELFFLQAYVEHLAEPGLAAERIKQLSVDTVHVPPRHVDQEVSLVVGFDTLGRAVIIVDTNNDEDFGNDERLVIQHVTPDNLSPKEREDLNSRFRKPLVSYEYFDGKEINKGEMRMSIWPYIQTTREWRFRNPTKNQILLGMGTFEHRRGRVQITDKSYTLVLSTRFFDSGVYTLKNSQIALVPSDSFVTLSSKGLTLSRVADAIEIGGEDYRVAEIDPRGEWIKLVRTTAALPVTGTSVGSFAKNITATSLEGKPFNLNKIRGRHVLLDFWWTGCAPCLQEIPYLNDLTRFFSEDQLLVIGIANDSGDALLKRQDKLRTAYPQIPVKENSEQILKDFGVEAYPSTYVVDPQGRIIYNAPLRGPEFFRFFSHVLADSGAFNSIVLKGNVHFTYSTFGATRVEVSGDFSDWQQVPMYNVDGFFRRHMQLPPGEYKYRFLIDGIPKLDPTNNLYSVGDDNSRCNVLRVR